MKETKKSQTELILDYLKTGKSITPMDALQLFGCFRLSGRIWDLRVQGHKIKTETINDERTGKSYASYSLIGA